MMYIPEYARITTGLGKLTPDVMSRIGQATEKTLGEQSVNDYRAESVNREGTKWFVIVDYLPVKYNNSGFPYVWKYRIKPAAVTVATLEFLEPAAVTVIEGSNSAIINALNTVELGTTEAIISPGVNWADIPVGFELQPIQPGTVVLCTHLPIVVGSIPVVAGTTIIQAWGFSMVNAITGQCI